MYWIAHYTSELKVDKNDPKPVKTTVLKNGTTIKRVKVS
jgi:hypothetical protein